MAFFESPRFPERISLEARGGPGFATDVVTVESGREKRNARWAYPRHQWDVSHAVRTEAQYKPLHDHFMSAKGRANGFRFKDFTDYRVLITEGLKPGDKVITQGVDRLRDGSKVEVITQDKKPPGEAPPGDKPKGEGRQGKGAPLP